jgi:hypothetical protein
MATTKYASPLNKCSAQPIKIGSEMILFKESGTDLGIMLDSQLTMQPQVNKMCSFFCVSETSQQTQPLSQLNDQNECCWCFSLFSSQLWTMLATRHKR